MKQMKHAAGCVLALILVTGCNTVAGVGQDLQAAGSAISETSDDVRAAFNASGDTVETAPACDEPVGRSIRAHCR